MRFVARPRRADALTPARRLLDRTECGYIAASCSERTTILGAILLRQRQIDAAASISAVLSHPTRLRILDFVGHARQASPAMYSGGSEMPLATVRYHFAALRESDCLALSETRGLSGSGEDMYRLAPLGQRLLQLAADL